MSERAPDGTAYALAGPEDGERVVLIHGLGLLKEMWAPFVERLSQADPQSGEACAGSAGGAPEPRRDGGTKRVAYRVLSYDLFGHGESGLPPATPSLTVYANQLAALIDHVGWEAAHIVGFSLGGMINRRFAMDHPGRARSLAIIASPHERGGEAQALVEQRAKDSAAGPAATLDAAIERWFTPGFRAARPDYIEWTRERVLANDPANFAACRWVLANGVVELIRPDPPIALPTLVMTAEHDSGSTPAMARAIASEIPGAATIVVPHLQHMGLVEDVDAFAAPLESFIERNSP